MTNNQKMLLGVGAVAVVGYLLWKRQQTAFTGKLNATGSKIATYGICPGCNVTGCSGGTKNHPDGVCAGTTTNPRTGQLNSTISDCGTCQVIYESNPSGTGNQMIPNFPTYSPNIGGFLE